MVFFTKKIQRTILGMFAIKLQILKSYDSKNIDTFLRKWLWSKIVTNQIFQRLYYLISILDQRTIVNDFVTMPELLIVEVLPKRPIGVI